MGEIRDMEQIARQRGADEEKDAAWSARYNELREDGYSKIDAAYGATAAIFGEAAAKLLEPKEPSTND